MGAYGVQTEWTLSECVTLFFFRIFIFSHVIYCGGRGRVCQVQSN